MSAPIGVPGATSVRELFCSAVSMTKAFPAHSSTELGQPIIRPARLSYECGHEEGPRPVSGRGPQIVSLGCAPRYWLVTPGSSRCDHDGRRSRTSGARVCDDPRTITEGRVCQH